MDASSPSTSKLLHQTQLRKYFTAANGGHDLTTVVEPNSKNRKFCAGRGAAARIRVVAVDLSAADPAGSGSDEENVTPPWHNETTMTISGTPEKAKKRQQRKTKSTKKAPLPEEEEEDDEEAKAYKQRLRNVSIPSRPLLQYHSLRIATTKSLQRRRTET